MIDGELKNYAIVLASGSGSRFGTNTPKQFEKVGDKTILEHSIEIFELNDNICEIILVVTPGYEKLAKEICAKNGYKKLFKILAGGKTRKDSSSIGVNSITENEANVIIHDCARPFLSQDVLNNCIEALKNHIAVDVAVAVTDTVLVVEDNMIKDVPDRKVLKNSQTPQCFRLSLIKKAHELTKNDTNFTDDCGLILKCKLAEIYVVEGNLDNIKITYPQDIYIANSIYNSKR